MNAQAPAEADVVVSTKMGDIYLKLYDETPKHKANFLKLANEGFYNGTTFHRVIQQFMIQGGDPNSKEAKTAGQAGQGGPGYTQDAEIVAGLYHKRGCLAAARQGDRVNPERKSSGSQFYIVDGKPVGQQELRQVESQIQSDQQRSVFQKWMADPKRDYLKTMDLAKMQKEDPDALADLNNKILKEFQEETADLPRFKYTEEQMKVYMEEGGSPHLDMQYTVFGEVVKGMDVVDKIAAVEQGPANRPKEDITMTVKVLKKK